MALFQRRSSLFVFLLLLDRPLALFAGMSGWGGCLDGQDVFAAVTENSPPVMVSSELFGDLTEGTFSWTLRGEDADWFYLEGSNLWLNTSADRVLDRETEGPVLMAELVCHEEDTFQSVYRIVVEILNENDNGPVFVDGSQQSILISELTPVNAVVFKALATDADNDKIIYSIDESSPGADYFKVLQLNSGEVVLARALDYESQRELSVRIRAAESSTAEQHSTVTDVSIRVEDGDDQYPHFTPCTILMEDATTRVCVNPTYSATVTAGQEDTKLTFHPGPIHAEDGDRGLRAPLSYVILTGNDEGHFLIDRHTGNISLTPQGPAHLAAAARHLQVMAFQDDDPRKYSVAAVVVRVLALNHFPPRFERPEYRGFVTAGDGPAALVQTDDNTALELTVIDRDFNQSLNPRIVFSFSSSNVTELFSLTQDGLIIARTRRLHSTQRHLLLVRATDEESGESTVTAVTVEVLAPGQNAPRGAPPTARLSGCVVGKVVFLVLGAVTVALCGLYLCLWMKRKLQDHKDPLERGSVAQGKHPNVCLRWFQPVSHAGSPLQKDLLLNDGDPGVSNPVFSSAERDSSDSDNMSVNTSDNTTENMTGNVENVSLETLPCDCSLGASETPPVGSDDPLSPSPTSDLPSGRIASAEIDKPLGKVSKRTQTPPSSPEQVLVRARPIQVCSSTSTSPQRAQGEDLDPTSSSLVPVSSSSLVPVSSSLVPVSSSLVPVSSSPIPSSSPSLVSSSSFSLVLTSASSRVPSSSLVPVSSSLVPASSLDGGEPQKEEDDRDSPDLLPDEEELLNIMERCHPVFITFRKF